MGFSQGFNLIFSTLNWKVLTWWYKTWVFLQDVWVVLFAAAGEGPASNSLRLRPSHQRRENWRNRHRPRKPLPVQTWSHVRTSSDLLHVSHIQSLDSTLGLVSDEQAPCLNSTATCSNALIYCRGPNFLLRGPHLIRGSFPRTDCFYKYRF